MNKYIALLRGINVGGNHIIPMKELVVMMEEMGCKEVKTYIQSGNVVFLSEPVDTLKFSEQVSAKISQHKGFSPKVWLCSELEWQQAIEQNPFSTTVGKALHFFFLESKPKNPDLEGLMTLKADSEDFKLTDKVFYLYAPDGIGRSKLVEKLGKYIDVPMTARNWNTIEKLASM